jgi:holo-[acyl-carrier protein] synthase
MSTVFRPDGPGPVPVPVVGGPATASASVWQDAVRTATELLGGALGGPGPVAPHADPTLRIGVDLVDVEEVARSVEQFGDRYVRRIFTDHEVSCCRTDGRMGPTGPGDAGLDYSYESLAARFAAKEATIKVLRPEGPRPEWRSIEVHRAASGWCELRLSGLAAALADRAGIDQLAVSMTHEASMGAAVVVATGGLVAGHDDRRGRGGSHPPNVTGEE